MNKIAFQVMGGFVLFLAAGLLFAGSLVLGGYSPRHYPSGSLLIFCARLIFAVALLGVTGVGLLKLRKWAALTLSILALYSAFWSAWAAIHPVDPKPGDASWLGYLYAVLLITPSIMTAKCWRILIWSGKKGKKGTA